jgi:predicted ATPase/DNA-binding SARP family transcriptional activator
VPVPASRALDVRLLGGFGVAVNGREVEAAVWRQKRAAALVKLLALEPTHRLHRDQLIDALWPELDPAAAANNLRVALHHARRGLLAAGAAPGTFLDRDADVISLGPSHLVQVDVDAFTAAMEWAWRSSDPAAVETALDRYAGDLLPVDLYDDWAEAPRTALRASYLTLLRRLAQLREQRGEHDQAIAALQRLLAVEPVDEEAHAALIRLFARSGRRRQAIDQCDLLVTLLERELGVDPQPATRELIASIREERFPATAPPVESAPPTGRADAPATTGLPRGLPAPVEDLIGREREAAELRQLLATRRLVTLTGPGGVGKTRLALAAARAAAAAFPDGVAFADLAPLEVAGLVLPTIARALGVQEVGGKSLLDRIAEQIGEGRVLMVVDNMEHVATAAPIVSELLAACPRLAALVTSRSRLRLLGEQEYPVQPLALPDIPAAHMQSRAPALAEMALETVPAVALFTRRAQAARPDFALTGANARDVAEICHRLDGLPLAIELAAARVRLLSVAELLDQLERPLSVLTGGPRDAPARQRTLRATIAWSHDLLTPEEQDLFARLSVFAGGFTIEGVQGVVGGEGGDGGKDGRGDRRASTPPERSATPSTPFTSSVLDFLASLVDQSLVRQADGPDGTARLGMLETIRAYARERLEFSGAADDVRRRHALHFLALAESAASELDGEDQAVWLDRLEREHDNLRQALTTLQDAGDGADELRMAAALWRFWWQRGYLSEGRRWLEHALEEGSEAAKATRATAHDGGGALAEAQGDLAAAAMHHEAALRLRRELGDRRGEARSLTDFGIIADKMGNPERAIELFTAALALARSEDDRPQLAACLANLGFVCLDRGDHQRAVVTFRESLELFRGLRDERNECYVLGGLGNLAFLAGDYAGASVLQEHALRLLRALGDEQGIADTVADLGHIAQRMGELDRAEALYVEAQHRYLELGDLSGAAFTLVHLGRLSHLRGDGARAEALLQEGAHLAWRLGEQPIVTEAMEGLAAVTCDHGEAARCARLLGAAEAQREASGTPLPAVHQPEIARCVTMARTALGESGYAAARGEGRALAPERALAMLASGAN